MMQRSISLLIPSSIIVMIFFSLSIEILSLNYAFGQRLKLRSYDDGFSLGYFDGNSEGLNDTIMIGFPNMKNRTGDYGLGYVHGWFLGCIDHREGLSLDDIIHCKKVYDHYDSDTSENFHSLIEHPYSVGFRDGFSFPPQIHHDMFTAGFHDHDSQEYKKGKKDGRIVGDKWYSEYSGLR